MKLTTALLLSASAAPTAALLLPALARAATPRMMVDGSSTSKKMSLRKMWGKATGEGDGEVSLVGDFMTKEPMTIDVEATLEKVARALTEKGITGAPVLEGGKVVGVISQKDLLSRAAGTRKVPLRVRGPQSERYAANTEAIGKALAGTVRDVMTRKKETVSPDSKMSDAAALMLRKKINRVLVVDGEDALVGILTTTDVLRLVLSECGTSKECLFE